MIRHSLFTSSFKLYLKRLLGIVAAWVLFLSLCRILNFLYVEDDERARIMWHNFYGQEENIDYICVGSSHVFNGVDPEILDQRTGENFYNMATTGQRLRESYYIIKEASHRNQLKGVYLDLYFLLSTEGMGNYDNFEAVSGGWENLDYRKLSLDRLDTFFHLNPPKYYISAALPFTRFREHLCSDEWIYSMQKNKKGSEYCNYQYCWNSENGEARYTEKGYFYHTQELQNLYLDMNNAPADMRMTGEAEEYLRKIIEFCQREGIEIVLFQTPVYKMEAIAYEKYDDYTAGVREIAEEYQVAYYDFNLAREEYFPVQEMQYFVDMGHLNAEGAKLFTNFFYEVLSGMAGEEEKLFYGSVQEKLASEAPQVVGAYYRQGTQEEVAGGEIGSDMYHVTIASNRETGMRYQIYLTPEGGETVMIQDFSENKSFDIPMEEHGICRIVWNEENDPENYREFETGY